MTNDPRRQIFADIVVERKYQDEKWGGPAHDSTETEANWADYITEYALGEGRAAGYDFRTRMVKVAALAVAALEAHDARVAADA